MACSRSTSASACANGLLGGCAVRGCLPPGPARRRRPCRPAALGQRCRSYWPASMCRLRASSACEVWSCPGAASLGSGLALADGLAPLADVAGLLGAAAGVDQHILLVAAQIAQVGAQLAQPDGIGMHAAAQSPGRWRRPGADPCSPTAPSSASRNSTMPMAPSMRVRMVRRRSSDMVVSEESGRVRLAVSGQCRLRLTSVPMSRIRATRPSPMMVAPLTSGTLR